MDLIAEHLWGVTDTTDNTESTSIGDSSSELWSSSNVHTSEEDRVIDLEERGELSSDWSDHFECVVLKKTIESIEGIV
jgi:hypothetical protein